MINESRKSVIVVSYQLFINIYRNRKLFSCSGNQEIQSRGAQRKIDIDYEREAETNMDLLHNFPVKLDSFGESTNVISDCGAFEINRIAAEVKRNAGGEIRILLEKWIFNVDFQQVFSSMMWVGKYVWTT